MNTDEIKRENVKEEAGRGASRSGVEPKDAITERIIKSAYAVSNALGCGFLEKVYENAMVVEMAKQGLQFEQQKALSVQYAGHVVGTFQPDFVVENGVIVELKAVDAMDGVCQAQLLNYLRASGVKIGLLLNFGKPRVEIKRMVL